MVPAYCTKWLFDNQPTIAMKTVRMRSRLDHDDALMLCSTVNKLRAG